MTKGTRSSRPDASRLSRRAALSRLLELLAAAVATIARKRSGPNHTHQEGDTGPKPVSMCEWFSL